jgi:hypothetical protein
MNREAERPIFEANHFVWNWLHIKVDGAQAGVIAGR